MIEDQKKTRIAVFERPGADFVLRRTLELFPRPERVRAAMAVPSRFVLLAPFDNDIAYLRAESVPELFTLIGQVVWALNRDGYRDIYVDTSVEPQTKAVIDEALATIRVIAQPAANEP